jgi:hypothetical protein
VLRFGAQIDVQGLLAGTPDSERRIGYLAKYLTKSMTEAHTDQDQDGPNSWWQAAHVDRLHAALQLEPCSPSCANWLRYGIQPKGARAGMAPGTCRSKAHQREHLGYAGRRILVSRKWTGKTLADHRYDRRAWVLETLGITADPADQYDQGQKQGQGQAQGMSGDKTRDQWRWEPAQPDDDIPTRQHRLLLAVADRQRWQDAYEAARDGKHETQQHVSAAPDPHPDPAQAA